MLINIRLRCKPVLETTLATVRQLALVVESYLDLVHIANGMIELDGSTFLRTDTSNLGSGVRTVDDVGKERSSIFCAGREYRSICRSRDRILQLRDTSLFGLMGKCCSRSSRIWWEVVSHFRRQRSCASLSLMWTKKWLAEVVTVGRKHCFLRFGCRDFHLLLLPVARLYGLIERIFVRGRGIPIYNSTSRWR